MPKDPDQVMSESQTEISVRLAVIDEQQSVRQPEVT
jgi:hypothetical protein